MANILSQIGAHFIDGIVVLLFSGFFFEWAFPFTREALFYYFPILFLFIWIFYHALLSSRWGSGQTIGKAFNSIAVGDFNGKPLSFRDSLFRTALTLIFFLIPILFLFDLICTLWTKEKNVRDKLSDSKIFFIEKETQRYYRVRGVSVGVMMVALFNLFQLYYQGQPQSFPEYGSTSTDVFIKEVELAAEGGDPKSQFSLGMIYFTGKEIPQNYKEAAKWFQKAADQGNARSQYQLAVLYASGMGVPKDFSRAVKLLKLASEGGDANAQEALRKLASIQ